MSNPSVNPRLSAAQGDEQVPAAGNQPPLGDDPPSSPSFRKRINSFSRQQLQQGNATEVPPLIGRTAMGLTDRLHALDLWVKEHANSPVERELVARVFALAVGDGEPASGDSLLQVDRSRELATHLMADGLIEEAKDMVIELRDVIRLMSKEMHVAQQDLGDIIGVIRELARYRCLPDSEAASMTSVAEKYHKRLTSNTRLDATPLFHDTTAFIPMAANPYFSHVVRLKDAIVRTPFQSDNYEEHLRGLEGTREVKLGLRDVIAFPGTYHITLPWMMHMLFSFLLLLVITFINVDLINLRFILEPYVDGSDGCFFESRTECCRSRTNNKVDALPAGDPRYVDTSCCSFNCMWNAESYGDYRTRFINFVTNVSSDCQDMLLAVGGARVEDTADLQSLYVVEYPFNQADIQNNFSMQCSQQEVCQRFVIITNQLAKKNWTRTLFSMYVEYHIFVESSWRFVDTKCQRNLRTIAVPGHTVLSNSAVAAASACFFLSVAMIVVFLCAQRLFAMRSFREIFDMSDRRLPTKEIEKLPERDGFFFRLVFSRLMYFTIVVLFAMGTAAMIPANKSLGLLIGTAVSCVLMVFLQIIRWGYRFKASLGVGIRHHYSSSKLGDDYASQNRFEWLIGAKQRDENYVNSCGAARMILSMACVLFFIVSPSILLHNSEISDRKSMLNTFETWTTQRSWFSLFHIAFAPMGLELIYYLPHLIGSSARFPSVRYVVIFYVLIFIWFPNSTSLPTSLDEVTDAVLGFLDTITVDFGPLGSGQRRLGAALGLLMISFFFLQAIWDLEEAVAEKSRVVYRSFMVDRQCVRRSQDTLWKPSYYMFDASLPTAETTALTLADATYAAAKANAAAAAAVAHREQAALQGVSAEAEAEQAASAAAAAVGAVARIATTTATNVDLLRFVGVLNVFVHNPALFQSFLSSYQNVPFLSARDAVSEIELHVRVLRDAAKSQDVSKNDRNPTGRSVQASELARSLNFGSIIQELSNFAGPRQLPPTPTDADVYICTVPDGTSVPDWETFVKQRPFPANSSTVCVLASPKDFKLRDFVFPNDNDAATRIASLTLTSILCDHGRLYARRCKRSLSLWNAENWWKEIGDAWMDPSKWVGSSFWMFFDTTGKSELFPTSVVDTKLKDEASFWLIFNK